MAPFRCHCGICEPYAPDEFSGLTAALAALRGELAKLGVKPDYAGYYSLGIGYRGVDAIHAAVPLTTWLKPLPDDPLWLPHQRGELLGFRLIEEAP